MNTPENRRVNVGQELETKDMAVMDQEYLTGEQKRRVFDFIHELKSDSSYDTEIKYGDAIEIFIRDNPDVVPRGENGELLVWIEASLAAEAFDYPDNYTPERARSLTKAIRKKIGSDGSLIILLYKELNLEPVMSTRARALERYIASPVFQELAEAYGNSDIDKLNRNEIVSILGRKQFPSDINKRRLCLNTLNCLGFEPSMLGYDFDAVLYGFNVVKIQEEKQAGENMVEKVRATARNVFENQFFPRFIVIVTTARQNNQEAEGVLNSTAKSLSSYRELMLPEDFEYCLNYFRERMKADDFEVFDTALKNPAETFDISRIKTQYEVLNTLSANMAQFGKDLRYTEEGTATIAKGIKKIAKVTNDPASRYTLVDGILFYQAYQAKDTKTDKTIKLFLNETLFKELKFKDNNEIFHVADLIMRNSSKLEYHELQISMMRHLGSQVNFKDPNFRNQLRFITKCEFSQGMQGLFEINLIHDTQFRNSFLEFSKDEDPLVRMSVTDIFNLSRVRINVLKQDRPDLFRSKSVPEKAFKTASLRYVADLPLGEELGMELQWEGVLAEFYEQENFREFINRLSENYGLKGLNYIEPYLACVARAENLPFKEQVVEAYKYFLKRKERLMGVEAEENVRKAAETPREELKNEVKTEGEKEITRELSGQRKLEIRMAIRDSLSKSFGDVNNPSEEISINGAKLVQLIRQNLADMGRPAALAISEVRFVMSEIQRQLEMFEGEMESLNEEDLARLQEKGKALRESALVNEEIKKNYLREIEIRFEQGNLWENAVWVYLSLDNLANEKFEVLIPQYGDMPMELYPDFRVGNRIIDAKRGMSGDNIAASILKYVKEFQFGEAIQPIYIVVAKFNKEELQRIFQYNLLNGHSTDRVSINGNGELFIERQGLRRKELMVREGVRTRNVTMPDGRVIPAGPYESMRYEGIPLGKVLSFNNFEDKIFNHLNDRFGSAHERDNPAVPYISEIRKSLAVIQNFVSRQVVLLEPEHFRQANLLLWNVGNALNQINPEYCDALLNTEELVSRFPSIRASVTGADIVPKVYFKNVADAVSLVGSYLSGQDHSLDTWNVVKGRMQKILRKNGGDFYDQILTSGRHYETSSGKAKYETNRFHLPEVGDIKTVRKVTFFNPFYKEPGESKLVRNRIGELDPIQTGNEPIYIHYVSEVMETLTENARREGLTEAFTFDEIWTALSRSKHFIEVAQYFMSRGVNSEVEMKSFIRNRLHNTPRVEIPHAGAYALSKRYFLTDEARRRQGKRNNKPEVS